MRVAILGNSGSGKSTLANWLAQSANLAILDLDSVAWELDQPAVARSTALAEADVAGFCTAHARWVLEGCYGNLVEAAFKFQPFLIFLNPGLETCTAHCLNRPWEPHKYRSKQEQDANLQFLLPWVAEYYTRDGPMSLGGHQAVFARYPGRKVELQRVPQLNPPDAGRAADRRSSGRPLSVEDLDAREYVMPGRTLFEAVGSSAGVLRLAHAWHERVLADDIVAHAFSHGFHPQHTERLAAYWAEAWGGPPVYSEQYGGESAVVRMHSGNGRHEEMDRRAIECFDQAMEDVGLADPRLRRVLHAYFEWVTTTTMTAYPDKADVVPAGLRIPHWSWEGLQP